MKRIYNYFRQISPVNTRLSTVFLLLIAWILVTVPARAQLVSVDLTEASPETSIEWIRTQVEDVINKEALSKESNAARHLLHYLDRAMGTYIKGMPDHSARHMQIFIQKVERLQHAHRVSEETCVLLIDASIIVIEKLNAESASTGTASTLFDNDAYKDVINDDSPQASLSNSPNPFNPTTTIHYSLTEATQATLTVYDLTGREVHQLVNGFKEAGTHQVTFDASSLPSGTYLYRLVTPGNQVVQKMVLLK